MPYNVDAESFHTKKLCSRLSSRKVQFSVRKTKKIVVFEVDFLLVIIEHFSLGAFVLSQFTRLTDRRTDRQTLIGKTALHTMQRGKNYSARAVSQ